MSWHLVVVLTVTVSLACGGDKQFDLFPTTVPLLPPEQQPSSIPTLTPEPTPVLPSFPGVSLQELEVGPILEFPEHLAIVVETGCTQCDGPATGLRRYWRNVGVLHVDELFERREENLGADNFYITNTAISPDGATVVVSVCTRKYCGGMGFAWPDATADFHISTDGGVTWSVEPQDEALRAFALTPDGWATGRWWTDDPIRLDDRALQRPAGVTGVFYPSRTMGRLLWIAGNRVLNLDGSEFVRIDKAESVREVIYVPGHAPIVGWMAPDQSLGYMLTRQDPSGQHIGYRYEGYLLSAVPIDSAHFLADVSSPRTEFGRVPALVDFDGGLLSPLDVPEPHLGRNTVIAAYRGPFVEIAIEPNSCASLRGTADPSSDEVECLAGGVLLRDLDERVEAARRNWLRVSTFDGRTGWIDAQHVQVE